MVDKIIKSGLLSIIIPCYNEEEGISNTISEIFKLMKKTNIYFEIILIDDGSKDDTFQIISNKVNEYPGIVRVVSFSRNFGKEAAILAGLKYSNGDCAVIMDSDLQHPPNMISEMYDLWISGYDVIEGIKKSRQKENLLNKIFAKIFYAIFSNMTGIDMRNASDFKLIDRKVIELLVSLPEKNTFFRGLTFWSGYKMITVEYEVGERILGETKWSLKSLFKYAISNVISFSSAPLKIINWLSLLMIAMSMVFGIRAFQLYFTHQAAGGITTVVCLILLSGGLILLSLSIIGEYISQIYEEIKGRPSYIINSILGFENSLRKETT